MVSRFVSFFTSLRLTVVCLCLAVALVFVGTLAQVDEGLYAAQNRYFRSLFIYWTPKGVDWRVPVFPGGYLIGGMLLLNLVAAHIKRFSFSRKKVGIFLTHVGLVILLLGGLLTDVFQVETHMRLSEGQSKNYSESGMQCELAIIDKSASDSDEVVAVPETILAKRGGIRHSRLPFTLRVREYAANSSPLPRGPMVQTKTPPTSQGVGQKFEFQPRAVVTKMNDANVPATVVEVMTPQGSLGTWALSNWAVDDLLLSFLLHEQGWQPKWVTDLSAPQQFSFEGHTYELTLRPARYYKPYSVELLEFRHDKYKGTEVPKNFSSLVRVRNPRSGEDREVKIYMNNPLRYAGETYYQASFDKFDPHVTVLQVVRNPGWLTPYIACGLIAAGLITQFLMHLISFARKRGTGKGAPAGSAARKARKPAKLPEVAVSMTRLPEALPKTSL
jgi:hypothetical protein